VLAQQVFFAQRDFERGPLQRFSMDAWDGYEASRDRILAGIAERRVENPVVLTGDVHEHWAADLKADFDDPASTTLGSELVCTSITSGGDGSDAVNEVVLAESPHVKYNRNRRGYVRC
jgi:alkaline phosphatase D